MSRNFFYFNMIKQIVLVALGGSTGSVLRYLSSLWIMKRFPYRFFPLGTFIVNITGCFIMGFLLGLLFSHNIRSEESKLLLIVGFCGGYTTFSALSSESLQLFEAGNYWTLALYITGSVLLGIVAVWSGNVLSKIMI